MQNNREILKTSEVAQRLRVSQSQVKSLVYQRRIPAFKVGRAWRFIWDDVMKALQERS